MREGESCIHNCLASSSNPLTEKKTKSKNKTTKQCLSSLSWTSAAPASSSWQSLLDGRSRGSCVKPNARVRVGRLLMCFLGGEPLKAGAMREHGLTRLSVQSQEWLSVFILSLLLMFQGPSFYHRLRSNRGKKEKDMITNNSWWQQFWNLGIQILYSPYYSRHSK